MEKTEAKEAIRELTLALMYLCRFTEDKDFFESKEYKAWKGYDFDVLNELSENEYIYDRPKRKSIEFFDKGIEEAKRILEISNRRLEK